MKDITEQIRAVSMSIRDLTKEINTLSAKADKDEIVKELKEQRDGLQAAQISLMAIREMQGLKETLKI